MLLIAIRKGGAKCSSACPYYEDTGVVRGVHGLPLKTHCRGTMQDVIVDCDVWNPKKIDKLEVTEAEWATFQQMLGRKAKRERKPWPEDHEEIHPVGYNWKHRVRPGADKPSGDKWNAEKSRLSQVCDKNEKRLK